MDYSIRELSEMAGVSARTLRYYDEIGLLEPKFVNAAGYRFYGQEEVERLQQILFYRERGFELKQIRQILNQEDFDLVAALEEHLWELEAQRAKMDTLIGTVRMTLASVKGEYKMSDKERFAAFKEEIIRENEEKYGNEIRQKYGDEEINVSNQKILNMSETEYQQFEQMAAQINERLEAGIKSNLSPESKEAEEIFRMHKDWLMKTWNQYTPDAHKGVAQMYVMDERFISYYDKNTSGCAELLAKIVSFWAK